jgi:hypothetical protein
LDIEEVLAKAESSEARRDGVRGVRIAAAIAVDDTRGSTIALALRGGVREDVE